MHIKTIITLFCLITLIVVGQGQSPPIDSNYNYQTFMIQFNRTYTGEEKDRH